jgi:hypothetical protein
VIEPNKQHIVMLPINKKQQVNFPNNFKIIVKDSSFNSIEKYDRE